MTGTTSSLPPVSLVRQYDTHRLVPSKYLPKGDSVLVRLSDDNSMLSDIFDLDHATNERLMAENDLLPGIGIHELVFGVPNYRVINATFCHGNPLGNRFNGPERGAWYAAFEVETAQTEVAFHKTVQLAEIGRFNDDVTYDDYLADFSAEFYDLRSAPKAFANCLDPGSYVASQKLADRLLRSGALGVIFPSVRRPGGTCLACFQPAIVGNVRKSSTYRFSWDGQPEPRVLQL